MTDFIIDTNVAVIANRQNTEVAPECVDACIQFLSEIVNNHIVLLDQGDEIRKEYSNAIATARPYQLGAQFLVHIIRKLGDCRHVRQVHLPKDELGEFIDFPNDPQLGTL